MTKMSQQKITELFQQKKELAPQNSDNWQTQWFIWGQV